MKLYKHQKEIIDADPKYSGLFMGTGSGKTLTALLLAKGKTLVICPKTQAEDKNWEREYEKNKKSMRLTSLRVLSKETFKKLADDLPNFDTLIVDEAHTCLGVTPNVRWIKKKAIPKTSQLFEELGLYVMRAQPKRIYLCTATIIRTPMTVWGAGKILGQEWDWYEFRNTYYTRLPMPGREVFVPKTDNATKDRLAKTVQGLGFTGQLSDYFDVPDQTYKTVFIDLTETQKKRIKTLKVDYPDPLVLIGKKHQVENGVLSGDEFSNDVIFQSQKVDKILDYAIEFPKMVIFAKYRLQIEQIALALKGINKKVLILTGDTKDRGALLKEANLSKDCVFLAQAQISAGYELPDYPVMVFASMSYSVVDRVQGEGRILRANALKKNLFIDLVVKDGIDNAVYNSIANKKDFNERIYLKDND